MDTTLPPSQLCRKEQDIFRTISLATLLTGTLNSIAASIHFYFTTGYGASIKLYGAEEPVSFFSYLANGGMCKYISGAVFGSEASTGGTLMIIWGIVFHFMITFAFTALLFIVYSRIIKWVKEKFIVVLIYGFFTWTIMNLVVIPLSKINKLPSDAINAITGLLIVTLMATWPVVFIAHRFYARKRAA